MAQRLLRRLADDEGGSPASSGASPRYLGRLPIAEFVPMSAALRAAILDHADAADLQNTAAKCDGYSSLRDSADSLVAQQLTTDEEVQRVLGIRKNEPQMNIDSEKLV
jgi:type II secretory ATPase GspE/PulE/Tfp pilus assembly ATPase PilB-like protein